MKRPIVIAVGLLLAALLVAGSVAALLPEGTGQPTYTVAEVTTGLRQHPRQWVGRTVAVRGVAIALYMVGSTGTGRVPASSWWSLMLDPVPHIGQRIGRATAVGQVRLNAPGMVPTLLLRGTAQPAPTLLDRARRFVAQLAAHLGPARRTNTYNPSPPQPRVYRVQLLVPARCPAPLAPPCYTAVMR